MDLMAFQTQQDSGLKNRVKGEFKAAQSEAAAIANRKDMGTW